MLKAPPLFGEFIDPLLAEGGFLLCLLLAVFCCRSHLLGRLDRFLQFTDFLRGNGESLRYFLFFSLETGNLLASQVEFLSDFLQLLSQGGFSLLER